MQPSLQPLLPALDNPAIFYLCAVLLAILVFTSLTGRLRAAQIASPPPHSLATLRRISASSAWVILTFWLAIGTGLIVFAGAVGGSWTILVVGVASFLITFTLLSLLFLAWYRGKVWADWLVLALALTFFTSMFAFQRLWICEPMAWSGVQMAQMCTAKLYAEGSQGAIKDPAMGAQWYGKAAVQGNRDAINQLLLVTPNKRLQRQYLEAAAQAGNAQAFLQLYKLQGPQQGLNWLERAIDAGVGDAFYEKSLLLRRSQAGLSQDIEQANMFLHEAGERGSSAAAAELSLMYELGEHQLSVSRQQSQAWADKVNESWAGYQDWHVRLTKHREIRDAAEQGDAQAMLVLANRYRSKAKQQPSATALADEWFARAAEAGSPEAQFDMAFIYFKQSNASAQQLADARRWLTAAADQQHRYALSNISHYLTNGQYGFQIDLQQAHSYASTLVQKLLNEKQTSQRDLALAQERLKRIQIQLNQENSWQDGLQNLQFAEARDDAQATFQLYEKHAQDRLHGDRERAQELLLKAANLGHLEARFRVARRTLTQPRTAEQETQAYAWMQEAAVQKHRGALVFMGRIYLRGLPKHGLDKDPDLARNHFEQALEGLEGDIVYARRNGSTTVSTSRKSVEKLLANLASSS